MSAPDADSPALGDIDFNHPYTPYDVQTDFMKTAYGVLQRGNGQVGILESPTGTVSSDDNTLVCTLAHVLITFQGKSLSLICASLTWLRNQRIEEHEASMKINLDDFKDEPDWIVEQMLRRKREDLARTWEEREKKLEQIRQKEKALEARSAKRRRFDDGPSKSKARDIDEDDEWLLDEADDSAAGDGDAMSGLSKETKEILTRFGLGSLKPEQEEDKVEDGVKVRKPPLAAGLYGNMNLVRYTTHQERIPSLLNSSLSCDDPPFHLPSRRPLCNARVKTRLLPGSPSSICPCRLARSSASTRLLPASALSLPSMIGVPSCRSPKPKTNVRTR